MTEDHIRTPRYTLHEGSSVPSVPPRFTPSNGILLHLQEFQPKPTQRVGRNRIVDVITQFGAYTQTVRSQLDETLPALIEREKHLTPTITEGASGHAPYAYVLQRLTRLRKHPAVQALEDLPQDTPRPNDGLPRPAINPRQIPARDKLRFALRSTLQMMDPNPVNDTIKNRNTFASIVWAQAAIVEEITNLKNYLKSGHGFVGGQSRPPQAIVDLHTAIEKALHQLDEAVSNFSGILEWHMRRIEQPLKQAQQAGR